jgi:hypothetical protein
MVAIEAQKFAFDHMAKKIARHVDRDCRIVSFPCGAVPIGAMKYLDLDETSVEATQALLAQAQADVNVTLSVRSSPDNGEGSLLDALFEGLPIVENERG